MVKRSVAEPSPPRKVSSATDPAPDPTKFPLIRSVSPANPLCIVSWPALLKVATLKIVLATALAPGLAATIVPVELLVTVSDPPEKFCVAPALFQVPLLVRLFAPVVGAANETAPVSTPLLMTVVAPMVADPKVVIAVLVGLNELFSTVAALPIVIWDGCVEFMRMASDTPWTVPLSCAVVAPVPVLTTSRPIRPLRLLAVMPIVDELP